MSWVEVDGAGWRRVHGLVISVLKNKALLRKQVLQRQENYLTKYYRIRNTVS